jgi:hypothetical protein
VKGLVVLGGTVRCRRRKRGDKGSVRKGIYFIPPSYSFENTHFHLARRNRKREGRRRRRGGNPGCVV